MDKSLDSILKKVHFKISLAINGQLGDCVTLSKKSTVETVVLLNKNFLEAKDFV